MLFITHDLSTLASVCERLAVMYAGRFVEEGPAHEVFADAAHPYTTALAAAFPVIGDTRYRMAPVRASAATRPTRASSRRAARSIRAARGPTAECATWEPVDAAGRRRAGSAACIHSRGVAMSDGARCSR